MEFLITVVVLTSAYFLVKKIRGPLPPEEGPPRLGGRPYDPDAPKTPPVPVNEE
jgi:hypothetical protein